MLFRLDLNIQQEIMFLIDNDLEKSKPMVLERLYNKLTTNKSIDVVYGYQKNRKGNLSEKTYGQTFLVVN